MKKVIKIDEITIKNLKNVSNGTIKFSKSQRECEKANIVGLYGQNASGKTAIVDAFKVLDRILHDTSLNDGNEELINVDKNYLELNFKFKAYIDNKSYFIFYTLKIKRDEKMYDLYFEELKYKEIKKNAKPRRLILFNRDQDNGKAYKVKNINFNSFKENEKVSLLISAMYSKDQAITTIFNERIYQHIISEHFNTEEKNLYELIYYDFSKNLHVIENVDYGLLISNLVMPFTLYDKNIRGTVGVITSEDEPLTPDIYELLKNSVFPKINNILPYIIPGVNIEIKKVGEKVMNDSKEGVMVQLISNRKGKRIPLINESDGVKKLISITSVLNSVFNEVNSCVVIDELDSGIFEYLLGELLKILHESGKGQLIFTSHNLRVLETVPTKNIWFTTVNPDKRYIQLKNISTTSNSRDVYLRAIQMNDESEKLYEKTIKSRIKRAFMMSNFEAKVYD
ncbi:AAA family ATPase [Staphylococcus hominis]